MTDARTVYAISSMTPTFITFTTRAAGSGCPRRATPGHGMGCSYRRRQRAVQPLRADFFQRLVAVGMPRTQAVGACVRKLLMICYGVLWSRTPFDLSWSVKKTRLTPRHLVRRH